jgi:hypothetical protein
MKHITNRRDPRIDGDGNIIEGRDVPLPEKMPAEWVMTEEEQKCYKDPAKIIAYESGCVIGKPKKSEKLTVEELEEGGMIGLYREE